MKNMARGWKNEEGAFRTMATSVIRLHKVMPKTVAETQAAYALWSADELRAFLDFCERGGTASQEWHALSLKDLPVVACQNGVCIIN